MNHKIYSLKNYQVYRDNNKDKNAKKSANRRSYKLSAMPNWLTDMHKMQIEWFYAAAKMMSETSGIKHHVDHIHPLKGIGYCGLHVPWNLQILTHEENVKKANKLENPKHAFV
jgi:5-methylcytosine-specific restriction endonuclease McrA